MLIDHLYTLEHFFTDEEKLEASVKLNVQHKIFEGHFPGQPILPGVCQLQIIKELLEQGTKQQLFLSEASSCKFLQMIDPTQINEFSVFINFKSEANFISCQAVIKKEEMVFLKMSGNFSIFG